MTSSAKAMLAAIMAIAGSDMIRGTPKPRTRTFKVHPKNYTKPMVVSSFKEISAWNNDVIKAKRERMDDRLNHRQAVISAIVGLGGSVDFSNSRGKISAYLLKQLDHITRTTALR